MGHQILYNNKLLEYTIIRKNVKNINLRILPNGEIVVSCAEDVSLKEIELLIYKRIKWIIKRVDYFKENSTVFENKSFSFVDGEAFSLNGFLYRFKIIESDEFKVVIDGNFIKIYKPKKCNLSKFFNKWLDENIKNYFNDILVKANTVFLKYIKNKPTIIYKTMATRWGTCNSQKSVITLNKNLHKISSYLSEYIVIHEYTHLIFKNHDSNFYSFLTTLVPDWKKREKILNSLKLI